MGRDEGSLVPTKLKGADDRGRANRGIKETRPNGGRWPISRFEHPQARDLSESAPTRPRAQPASSTTHLGRSTTTAPTRDNQAPNVDGFRMAAPIPSQPVRRRKKRDGSSAFRGKRAIRRFEASAVNRAHFGEHDPPLARCRRSRVSAPRGESPKDREKGHEGENFEGGGWPQHPRRDG